MLRRRQAASSPEQPMLHLALMAGSGKTFKLL